MEEPYVEGLATHGDPESCAGSREDVGEALTGAQAGRVLSRENTCTSGVLTVWTCWKATSAGSPSRDSAGPHAVGDLAHACEALRTGTGRSQGCPIGEGRWGRKGKSEDVLPR